MFLFATLSSTAYANSYPKKFDEFTETELENIQVMCLGAQAIAKDVMEFRQQGHSLKDASKEYSSRASKADNSDVGKFFKAMFNNSVELAYKEKVEKSKTDKAKVSKQFADEVLLICLGNFLDAPKEALAEAFINDGE